MVEGRRGWTTTRSFNCLTIRLPSSYVSAIKTGPLKAELVSAPLQRTTSTLMAK